MARCLSRAAISLDQRPAEERRPQRRGPAVGVSRPARTPRPRCGRPLRQATRAAGFRPRRSRQWSASSGFIIEPRGPPEGRPSSLPQRRFPAWRPSRPSVLRVCCAPVRPVCRWCPSAPTLRVRPSAGGRPQYRSGSRLPPMPSMPPRNPTVTWLTLEGTLRSPGGSSTAPDCVPEVPPGTLRPAITAGRTPLG